MHTTPFKKKPAHRHRSLWLAILIVSLTCFLQNTPQAEAWTYVPKGFTVTDSKGGVYGTVEEARLTLEALKTTRTERDIWKEAFSIASNDVNNIKVQLDIQLNELTDQINQERTAHRTHTKAIQKANRTNLIWAFLIGGIAGAAVGAN